VGKEIKMHLVLKKFNDMKKYLTYFTLCCISTLMASCEQDEDNAFSVEYTPVSVSPQGGNISFTIHASGKWTAAQTASWLTLRPETGEGDQTVTVAVAANTDAELNTRLRTANIYIIAGAHTSSLTVTQLGNDQPLPGTPAITGADANQCPLNSTVVLTASPVEYAVAYVWYRNGIVVQNHTSTSYTVRESGVYSVAGMNYAGSEGAKSAEKPVIIDPCPPANAGAIIGADANSCFGTTDKGSVMLTVPEIEHASVYTWYKGAQVVQSGPSNSYTAVESGYYSVAGSNVNGIGAPSPQKQVTITPCLNLIFGYGKTYRVLTCNKSILNTAAGNNMFDPFLSVYNAAEAGMHTSANRYMDQILLIFELNAQGAEQMRLRINYHAGTYTYTADGSFKLNRDNDGNIYFTNFTIPAGTPGGNMNGANTGPKLANNLLSYLLYEGTSTVGTSPVVIPPSGNKFKIDWAPTYTPGINLLGGLYVVSDPTNYIPGILGN
jgi:hypothetical protein